jgi:hypothetical protein
MSHLLSLALCLAGFAALAFATRRQQRDLFGRSLQPTTTYTLRFAGTCALILALGILVAGQGWALGLVIFSGHTTMTAGLAFCALIVQARMQQRTLRQQ